MAPMFSFRGKIFASNKHETCEMIVRVYHNYSLVLSCRYLCTAMNSTVFKIRRKKADYCFLCNTVDIMKYVIDGHTHNRGSYRDYETTRI